MRLRCLTLWQPMAWAISDFSKRIENRPWKPHAGVTHLAIHAGAKFHAPHAEQIEDVFGVQPPPRAELPSGAIVAVAELLGCVQEDDPPDDPWFSGPYGWRLGHVVKLPEPIGCAGALGLWRVPDVIRRSLADALDEGLQRALVVHHSLGSIHAIPDHLRRAA